METTESRNLSVSIERDADAAYAFLSLPENFRKWASGLGSLHRASGQWIAETPDGPTDAQWVMRDLKAAKQLLEG